jgi:hypothetical protein
VNLGVVSFSTVTLSQLQSLPYGNAPIDGSDVGNVLVPGDVFAVHTDRGNYSKVLVTGPFDSGQNNGLPIEWVTLLGPPQLTIIPSGPYVLLTWPTKATGFTLQSTTNLSSPIWTTNLPAPVVVNGLNTVTNSISGTQQFFRLSK